MSELDAEVERVARYMRRCRIARINQIRPEDVPDESVNGRLVEDEIENAKAAISALRSPDLPVVRLGKGISEGERKE